MPDDPVTDLSNILKKYAGDGEGTIYGADIKDLMIDLSIYIVNRDHKVMDHGIAVGKTADV